MLLNEKEIKKIIEILEKDDEKFGVKDYESGTNYTLGNSYDEETLIAEFANRFESTNIPKGVDSDFAMKVFDLYETEVLSNMGFDEDDFSIV
jgi:hypothetical protein